MNHSVSHHPNTNSTAAAGFGSHHRVSWWPLYLGGPLPPWWTSQWPTEFFLGYSPHDHWLVDIDPFVGYWFGSHMEVKALAILRTEYVEEHGTWKFKVNILLEKMVQLSYKNCMFLFGSHPKLIQFHLADMDAWECPDVPQHPLKNWSIDIGLKCPKDWVMWCRAVLFISLFIHSSLCAFTFMTI